MQKKTSKNKQQCKNKSKNKIAIHYKKSSKIRNETIKKHINKKKEQIMIISHNPKIENKIIFKHCKNKNKRETTRHEKIKKKKHEKYNSSKMQTENIERNQQMKKLNNIMNTKEKFK